MKLRNILIAGLSVWALSGCSDYLDVDAPSKLTPEYVFSDKKEINNALNGIYADMLTTDTYGGAFIEKFCFNTDVEIKMNSNQYNTSNSYQRYDCDPDGGDIKKIWDKLYAGIEHANMLIDGVEEELKKGTYDEDDSQLLQMLGEAKVLRAIFYHDLVWYFGDIPYSLHASYNNENKVYDVADRTQILTDLINDLKAIAPKMQSVSDTGFQDGVERISKEMAYAMIARLAMTAGGYSLRPDGDNVGKMERPANWKDFYKDAMDYTDMIITAGNFNLTDAAFYEVFAAECNFSHAGSDVIFEIPFARESTGNIGYITGVKMDNASGVTPHAWGRATSSAQLDAHYRFTFDKDDERRDYINQLFYYTQLGEATLQNARTVFNGKWSKLWNNTGLGSTTEGSTGINFPYMRYADVLLTYAEAALGYEGRPTPLAIQRYEQVRQRAFRSHPEKVARPAMYGDPDLFLKAVLDERKFEFAGENMRWRDLVRNNKLNEVVYMSFFRYYSTGEGLSSAGIADALSEYDFGVNADGDANNSWDKILPFSLYYYNNVDNAWTEKDNEGNVTASGKWIPFQAFPQSTTNMKICRIINPYSLPTSDDSKVRMVIDGKSTAPSRADYMSWYDDNIGQPREEILYCMRGYVWLDHNDGIFYWRGQNNVATTAKTPDQLQGDFSSLPPVRYILPYPRAVITRSQGKYVNKYGYK